VIVGPIDSDD